MQAVKIEGRTYLGQLRHEPVHVPQGEIARAIRAAAAELVVEDDPAAVRGGLDAGDLSSFERLFVGEGWAGVGFDDELGGQGGGLLELALTARELGRAAGPSASWLQSAIVIPALDNEPALVRAAAESGEVTALAVRADRIPAAVPSVARRSDRLNGQIPCVLGAARRAGRRRGA